MDHSYYFLLTYLLPHAEVEAARTGSGRFPCATTAVLLLGTLSHSSARQCTCPYFSSSPTHPSPSLSITRPTTYYRPFHDENIQNGAWQHRACALRLAATGSDLRPYPLRSLQRVLKLRRAYNDDACHWPIPALHIRLRQIRLSLRCCILP